MKYEKGRHYFVKFLGNNLLPRNTNNTACIRWQWYATNMESHSIPHPNTICMICQSAKHLKIGSQCLGSCGNHQIPSYYTPTSQRALAAKAWEISINTPGGWLCKACLLREHIPIYN